MRSFSTAVSVGFTEFVRSVGLAWVIATLITTLGSARAAEIRVPTDQPTIQDAIDAAAPGDVVLVAAGTYFESIDFRGNEVTVRGEGQYSFDTVIDGSGAPKPVVQLIRGEGSGAVLENLTLRGGTGRLKGGIRYGGGMVCRDASPVLREVWIEECTADVGGGIAVFRGAPVFEDVALRFNEAGTGAGAAFIQTTASITGGAIIGCTVPDVATPIPVARGIGIDCLDSVLTATDCRIVMCRTGFLDTDRVEGVGIAVRGTSELFLDGGILEENVASFLVVGDGTAIFVGDGARAEVSGVLFYENTTPNDGGAAFVDTAGSALFESCRFVRNVAGGDGGAIATESPDVDVVNALFLLNQAQGAGGAIASSTVEVLHATFVKNSSAAGEGGAVAGDLSITGSILWANFQPPFAPQQIFGSPTVRYCDVQGGFPGEGNIDEEPEFALWEPGDFRFMNDEYLLRIDSPCVDAADPSAAVPASDLYGDPRVVDGDGDGDPRPDMGAHEMRPEVAARYGDVDRGVGLMRLTYDQLFVNGEVGDLERALAIDFDDGIRIDVEPPLDPQPAAFVVQLHLGAPSPSTVRRLPARVGYSPVPFLLDDGASPSAVWNGLGVPDLVGASDYFGTPIPDPAPAPRTILDLPAGDAANIPPGTVFTLQGVIRNFDSDSPRRASATNAIVVTVE